MSPDVVFWLQLALKMAVTAGFVIAATAAAERIGPAIGALVATLPIAAGPSYLFLALDHDAAFIATSALSSLAVNPGTCVLALVYAALAQRHGLVVSFTAGVGMWAAAAFMVQSLTLSLAPVVLANVLILGAGLALSRRFRNVRVPLVTRRWYDVPLRATMVAALVALVVGASSRVGPAVTGVIAIFPVVFTSLMLILQPRIGGPATAAVLAHSFPGLVGFTLALLTVHVTAEPLGNALALGLALATSVAWNFALYLVGRARAAKSRAAAVSRPAAPP